MKGFISKLQKDLNKLQATLQTEGTDLIQKVKAIADKGTIEVKAREVEKLIAAKLKKFEPAFESLLHEIKKGAASAGVDISQLEQNIKDRTSAAKTRLAKTKAKVTKKATKVKKKAPAKSATKARTKKAPGDRKA